MFRLLRENNGFTLVEIIVSIAILGIIVTPLSSLFLASMKNNAMAQEREIAVQLAQKHMEEAMMNPMNYIGTVFNRTEEGFDIKIDGTVSIKPTDYELSNITGSRSLPTFDLIIDFSDTQMSSVESGDTLDVIVDDTHVKVKEGSLDIYSNSISQLSSEINLKVNCDNEIDIALNVFNDSEKRLNIYKVYTVNGENEIDVNTLAGEVYVYENIFDSSVSNIEKNRVYKITVTVTKNSQELVRIVNFKTID